MTFRDHRQLAQAIVDHYDLHDIIDIADIDVMCLVHLLLDENIIEGEDFFPNVNLEGDNDYD